MVRILNFACFALAALCCLGLYRVSEQTRIARIHLLAVEKQIVVDRDAMKVLQADWEQVSAPSRIQALAQSRLGLSDTATVALASLDNLPRRGDALSGTAVQSASMVTPVQPADPHLHLVVAHAAN
jgi:hypothetical protein